MRGRLPLEVPARGVLLADYGGTGTSTVVHERMAARPFVRFSRFDTAMFVDYGRKYYDNNQRVDEYYGKKPKEQKSKASMTGKRAYKAKRPQEKGKKKRPTSRPTSRPTRKR